MYGLGKTRPIGRISVLMKWIPGPSGKSHLAQLLEG